MAQIIVFLLLQSHWQTAAAGRERLIRSIWGCINQHPNPAIDFTVYGKDIEHDCLPIDNQHLRLNDAVEGPSSTTKIFAALTSTDVFWLHAHLVHAT
jgi:hypothetical protein